MTICIFCIYLNSSLNLVIILSNSISPISLYYIKTLLHISHNPYFIFDTLSSIFNIYYSLFIRSQPQNYYLPYILISYFITSNLTIIALHYSYLLNFIYSNLSNSTISQSLYLSSISNSKHFYSFNYSQLLSKLPNSNLQQSNSIFS